MNKKLLTLSLAAAALAGCSGLSPAQGPRAIATLQPTTNSITNGTVEFAQVGDSVRVKGEIRGLKPNAEHGFHVHEKGDCSSGDGMSAGGHFNPTSQPHGMHGGGAHHTGDLPSLKADANGVARLDFSTSALRVGTGPTDIVGKGLIVHRDPDDFKTQPTGNSGPRLACAVIAAR
jgi:Cu-Zn family superoxide dismutase